MSEPAVFAIVRDGQQRYYGDRWASVYFLRELVWGPQEFEAWVTQLQEIEEWDGDFSSAVVVDYDRRRVLWMHNDERLSIPKVAALYQRLLGAGWHGYQLEWVASSVDLATALGIEDGSSDADSERDQYDWQSDTDDPLLRYRPRSVAEACGRYEDVEDENDEDDDQQNDRPKLAGPTAPTDITDQAEAFESAELEFGDEQLRAWITITDATGAIRHRQLQSLPQDLLQGNPQALAQLSLLPPCEVPREEVVIEGMWIEESERTIGFWGSPHSQALLPILEKGWVGWDVQWAPRGYAQHCSAAGPSGQTLSVEQALAKLLPNLLSTERFNISTVVGAIGGSLKKTAIKGTGCLVLVVCSPLVIFGAISGNWQAVGITVAIVIALAAIVFKVVESRIKHSFRKNFVQQEEAGRTAPAAAGPLEPARRRQALEKLLTTAGLPPLTKVEPLFPPKSDLDFS